MCSGGRGVHSGDPKRAIVITILDTDAELHFQSMRKAAKVMGVTSSIISRLANNAYKRTNTRKCNGGKYLNKILTASFAVVR